MANHLFVISVISVVEHLGLVLWGSTFVPLLRILRLFAAKHLSLFLFVIAGGSSLQDLTVYCLFSQGVAAGLSWGAPIGARDGEGRVTGAEKSEPRHLVAYNSRLGRPFRTWPSTD